jgi:hypothetical protein
MALIWRCKIEIREPGHEFWAPSVIRCAPDGAIPVPRRTVGPTGNAALARSH